MIHESVDLSRYQCPLCGAGLKWFGRIPGNGVYCKGMCEKPNDPMQGYTVWYDLNDLKLKKGE